MLSFTDFLRERTCKTSGGASVMLPGLSRQVFNMESKISLAVSAVPLFAQSRIIKCNYLFVCSTKSIKLIKSNKTTNKGVSFVTSYGIMTFNF